MQCHQQDVSDSPADDSPPSLYERLQCHRTASPSPSRRSATPFLFTTGVSGTVPGRRQPPAMPQGAPVEGAPMGHRHHS